MMKNMKTIRWFLLISGILVVILGIWMLFTPLENLIFLAMYIGITLLISGVSEIVSYCGEEKEYRSGWMLASGILSTLFSLWVIFGRGMAALTIALPYVFAMWIMMSGIMRIVGSLSYKSVGVKAWGLLLTLGIIGAVFGFMLMFSPMLSAVVVAYTIAFMVIIHGVNNILLFFNVKKLGDAIRRRLG